MGRNLFPSLFTTRCYGVPGEICRFEEKTFLLIPSPFAHLNHDFDEENLFVISLDFQKQCRNLHRHQLLFYFFSLPVFLAIQKEIEDVIRFIDAQDLSLIPSFFDHSPTRRKGGLGFLGWN